MKSITYFRGIYGLIGGNNGCGKTTLFDAIYHALYGLEIADKKVFEQLFNAGAMLDTGLEHGRIILEVQFSGMVLAREYHYSLRRTYVLSDSGKVLESVTLKMGGSEYTYGSAMPQSQRAENAQIINKIIAANLPAELSNYFLFDAMKTSELVKEEQINKLIMNNINSVMGFNKYAQLRKVAEALLAEKTAERLENENQRQEYSNLVAELNRKRSELDKLNNEYAKALNYDNDNKTQYELIKQGRDNDDVTRDKIAQLEKILHDFETREREYVKYMTELSRELETKVVYAKLASVLRTEVEMIIHNKQMLANASAYAPNDQLLTKIAREIVELIEQRYVESGKIDVDQLIGELRNKQRNNTKIEDVYPYLTKEDVTVLEKLVETAIANPFITIAEQRERLNADITELPRYRKQLEDYKRALSGQDYTIIELYEANARKIIELRNAISEKKKEIQKLENSIAAFDYDIPQIPDPQYDMLKKLPDFLKRLSNKLLQSKKLRIENMMRDQLNLNLVIYAGYIGRVELSADTGDDITFKIYHKSGNEIYLSQLNAGAKQTVMQVLLKVLYNLGDYDPPVMIDTVMGVLDKESREVIIEKYFPDLAHQTILLSTDTEITTERDLEKIEAFVSKAYTLHRDKEKQCTTITEDYFGVPLNYD